MYLKKVLSVILSVALVFGIFGWMFDDTFAPTKIFASENIVSCPGAPLTSANTLYLITTNIPSCTIVVAADGITIDGQGYSLDGGIDGSGTTPGYPGSGGNGYSYTVRNLSISGSVVSNGGVGNTGAGGNGGTIRLTNVTVTGDVYVMGGAGSTGADGQSGGNGSNDNGSSGSDGSAGGDGYEGNIDGYAGSDGSTGSSGGGSFSNGNDGASGGNGENGGNGGVAFILGNTSVNMVYANGGVGGNGGAGGGGGNGGSAIGGTGGTGGNGGVGYTGAVGGGNCYNVQGSDMVDYYLCDGGVGGNGGAGGNGGVGGNGYGSTVGAGGSGGMGGTGGHGGNGGNVYRVSTASMSAAAVSAGAGGSGANGGTGGTGGSAAGGSGGSGGIGGAGGAGGAPSCTYDGNSSQVCASNYGAAGQTGSNGGAGSAGGSGTDGSNGNDYSSTQSSSGNSGSDGNSVYIPYPTSWATDVAGQNIDITYSENVGISGDTSKIRVYVNGAQKTVSSITSNAGTASIALAMPAGQIYSGDTVVIDYDNDLAYEQSYSYPLGGDVNRAVTNNSTAVLDVTPPTVSLTAPTASSYLKGSSVSLTATASDEYDLSGVQFRRGNTDIGTLDGSDPFSTTWNTTLVTDGAYTLNAVAVDSAGNRATSSASVTVDNTVPTVSLTAPTNSSFVTGSSVSLTATASDTNIAGVQFRRTNTNIGAEDTTSAYSTTWDSTGVADGAYTLNAVARDLAYNYATSSVSVTVDNTNPTVSLTAPANAATVSGSAVSITATASDAGSLTGVQFKRSNTNLGAEDTSSPFSTTWNTTAIPDGTYTLNAVARDSTNHFSTSTVTVTVDNTAPVLSDGLPTTEQSANTTSVDLTLTTDETATCAYSTVADTAYGSMTAFDTTNSTTHTTTVTGLTNGSTNNYYVRCADGQSNTNDSDYTITFTVASPAVTTTRTDTGSGVGGGSYSYTPSRSPANTPTNPNNIPTTIPTTFIFRYNRETNNIGSDVKMLQKFLNERGFTVSKTGPGSVGNETTKFGAATRAALIRFQKANGIKPAIGYFGPITRAVVNKMLKGN